MRLMIIDIIEWVAAAERQTVAAIIGDSRMVPLARARFAVVWVAHQGLGASLTAIARRLGDRDHRTIAHALRRAEALRACDPAFRGLTTLLLDRALERLSWEAAA